MCVYVQVHIWMCINHFYQSCSAKHAPSLKLMLVGLSGRGKSTLLSHLKYIGKTKTLPITHRQRWELSQTQCDFCNENGK